MSVTAGTIAGALRARHQTTHQVADNSRWLDGALVDNDVHSIRSQPELCFNFGNGVGYQRVSFVITHVIVDGDFELADLVQHALCTQFGLH